MNPGLTNVRKVVCTNDSVTVWLNTCELYSMGYNFGYQLGISTITSASATVKVPTQVDFNDIENIQNVYAGYSGIYLLMKNVAVYYSGANDIGQFGNDTTTDVLGFQLMSNVLSDIVDINPYITRGAFFLNSSGTVFFCGENILI